MCKKTSNNKDMAIRERERERRGKEREEGRREKVGNLKKKTKFTRT